MRRIWYLAVATAAAVATIFMVTPAYAAINVLTYGSVGGSNVSVGDVLTANLKAGTQATFYSAPGGPNGVKCNTSSFTASVTSNPVAPGTAVESVTAHTFSAPSCTVFGVPGVTGVNLITIDNLPYTGTTVASATKAVVINPPVTIKTTIKLNTALGLITCTYTADLNKVSGVASNVTTSITFTNQKFNKATGPGACFAAAYFSAQYGPVLDTSKPGSPTVYVN